MALNSPGRLLRTLLWFLLYDVPGKWEVDMLYLDLLLSAQLRICNR